MKRTLELNCFIICLSLLTGCGLGNSITETKKPPTKNSVGGGGIPAAADLDDGSVRVPRVDHATTIN